MEKVSINGIELAYSRRGRGAPLVLLHGYPLDHRIWDETASLLEDRFDLILPDLRGFGGSTTIDTPYSMDDFALDLAGLLERLGIQKAAVAGHSMGGYVALAFARLQPGRVSGLGLVSSQALADPPDRKEGRYKSAAEVAEKGTSGVVDTMAVKFTTNTDLQAVARKVMQEQNPPAYIGALKAMAERHDSTSLLTTLTCPIVLVHGDADVLIPIERAREIKDAVPSALLAELPGVGHLPMLEARDATARALSGLR